ncbi:MarR family transcriptional regulator [Piscirickettsia salmonis]|nr:MarR family transcriptional regulator [Piscirickettsia salmonis]ERL62029.1 marR family protein [Piscirickettsia salmonis LF-89 = ATCC VR-1361]APS47752.1 MarR family transcriptional regulator [Piscirickettsia salmonis]APS50818.1 MarR family transcriptional regulator [Piscirickettsia salmonis]APS54022.1 MarR family transcriptional regulator [Piscirickettsia salmonis]
MESRKLMQPINELEFLICDISNWWRRIYSCNSQDLGLGPTERRALYAIHQNPGLTQVQLAEFLDIEPQGLTRILDHFVASNWLRKEIAPHDRRARCLYLTPNATPIIEKIRAIGDKFRPQSLTGIDDDELTAFIMTIRKMKDNLASIKFKK